jgi:PGF-CTERM protein
VSADATESDVRKLGPVGENTTVHLPGTYDRSFPETDVQGAYEYLGIQQEPTPAGDGSGSGSGASDTNAGGPGFGLGVTLLALLGVALLAARRES